jgi:hypothetical protein
MMRTSYKVSNGQNTIHVNRYEYENIKKIITEMYPSATYVTGSCDEIKNDTTLPDGDYLTFYDSNNLFIFNKKTVAERGWFYTTYETQMTEVERWTVELVVDE